MKVRMYKVAMNTCQRVVESIEAGKLLRPEWQFVDSRIRSKAGEAPKKHEKLSQPKKEITLPPEPINELEKSYDDMSKPQKKDYLEKIAREYGVDLDKRKKLKDLEVIVEELLEG